MKSATVVKILGLSLLPFSLTAIRASASGASAPNHVGRSGTCDPYSNNYEACTTLQASRSRQTLIRDRFSNARSATPDDLKNLAQAPTLLCTFGDETNQALIETKIVENPSNVFTILKPDPQTIKQDTVGLYYGTKGCDLLTDSPQFLRVTPSGHLLIESLAHVPALGYWQAITQTEPLKCGAYTSPYPVANHYYDCKIPTQK